MRVGQPTTGYPCISDYRMKAPLKNVEISLADLPMPAVAMTQRHLLRASIHLSTRDKLMTVGVELGYKRPEVECVLTDNPNDIKTAAFKILDGWRGRHTSNTQLWRPLFEAFQTGLSRTEFLSLHKELLNIA